METPNYYSIIIAEVRYDKRLKANAKLLYSEITALTNQKGYCYASNRYFAELYGVSKITISNWISQLVKYGYITSQLEYKEGTKQIINRYIRLTKEGVNEKIKTPVNQIVKVNTKQINNKLNINKTVDFSNICYFYNEIEFQEVWKEFELVRKKKKASTSERAYKRILKNLMDYSDGDINKAILIVSKSADSGWSDLYAVKNNKTENNGSRIEQFLAG